ncbi:MAG: DUF2924 domain-containing protein [bacterium]
MGANIGKDVAAMREMSLKELRNKYAEVFGEATQSRHKQYLLRRIAWQLQANAEGGLSERARERAKELAKGADVRLTAPKKPAPPPAPERTRVGRLEIAPDDRLPMPGATISRVYKGREYEVKILPRGLEYDGEIYRSLSAVASAITGTHWNGYNFFKLGKKGGANGGSDD